MNDIVKYVYISNCVYSRDYGQYKKNYSLVTEIKNKEDYAVIVSNENEVCIAFRGSDDLDDWLDDLSIFAVYKEGYGKIHSGFAKCYFGKPEYLKKRLTLNSYCLPIIKTEKISRNPGIGELIINELHNHYKPNKKLVVTGHSKGGALAELCALHLRKLGYYPELYTFGCPMVGKREYCEIYSNMDIDYIRVVNKDDLVTKIPRSILGYCHHTDAYQLGKAIKTLLNLGNPEDHLMKYYIQHLLDEQNNQRSL